MGATAEVLLVRADGAVILQVRDDKPGITNPGLVSAFGGKIETGEEPIAAAVREINEETNLGLTKKQLRFYRTCHKTKAVHGEDRDVHYFVAAGMSDETLKVYEGQGYVIAHNKADLAKLKLTVLTREVLTDFFEGFRAFVLYDDMPEAEASALVDRYFAQAAQGKQAGQQTPVVLACAGLVAAGKSTVTAPLATAIGAVKISSDEIREIMFQRGYNFASLADIIKSLVERLTAARYHVFLDFNISNNLYHLKRFEAAGYRIFVIHANPPERFVVHKILSGNMKHELSFFPKDKHLLISMEGWRDAHYKRMTELARHYGIWAEVDTSQKNVRTVVRELTERLKKELAQDRVPK